MPEQPPFDPNSTGSFVRTDGAARKIIDRLDAAFGRPNPEDPYPTTIREEIVALKTSTVRWDRLIAILGAAATVIVSSAWKVQSDNLNHAEAIHAADMRAFRDDVHEDLRRAAIYSAATYQATVENRSKTVVVQEVRAATADAGVR